MTVNKEKDGGVEKYELEYDEVSGFTYISYCYTPRDGSPDLVSHDVYKGDHTLHNIRAMRENYFRDYFYKKAMEKKKLLAKKKAVRRKELRALELKDKKEVLDFIHDGIKKFQRWDENGISDSTGEFVRFKSVMDILSEARKRGKI